MNPKEAIMTLTKLKDKTDSYGWKCIDVAIDALEKQIPKKPETGAAWYVCPSCKHAMPVQRECCDNCGQAIDWSDYDD